MKSSLSRALRACGAGAAMALTLSSPSVSAAEPRTWISLDGRLLEAELVRRTGPEVELRDTEGRTFRLPLTSLSFGDQDYVNEFAPEDKSKTLAPLGGGNQKPKIPNPAKDAKIDTKVYKKDAGKFPMNNHVYSVCETPHFKILYIKPMDPVDVAELAERLWIDTAFFHSTFAQKWKDRKMAVMLVNDQLAYNYVGDWYADLIFQTGNIDRAQEIRTTWKDSASGAVSLPANMADENGVFTRMRVFRAFEPGESASDKSRPKLIKGVWIPFRTHCLASDMLDIQAGGVSDIGAKGEFAIFTGHAYFKEILLTGKSETGLLRAQSSIGSSVSGFKDGNWASELKRQVKKGDIKVNLKSLFSFDVKLAKVDTIVLAYSFARFLQSSQEKLASFNKLCERISTSNQIPEPDDLAQFYGLENGAALEKAWSDYILSAEFR